MPTQEELKFNSLRTRITQLTEDRARRLGELDSLKARLKNEFDCATLEEARVLHKQYQESIQAEGAAVATMITELEKEVITMEERVRA